jgi:hypothetical protein
MKYFTILLLSILSLNAAPVVIPIQPIVINFQAKDVSAATGVFNYPSALDNITGLLVQSNSCSMMWQLPIKSYSGVHFTNADVSFSFISTNGINSDLSGAHVYYYTLQLKVYTNNPATPTFGVAPFASPPYYTSSTVALNGGFPNGTNIYTVNTRFNISTNFLSNTNLAFGTLTLTHVTLTGIYDGNEWITGGQLQFNQ